jgi:isochorismate hydrolase
MSNNFLKQIENYNIRKKKPNKEKCTLIVIDMQNYFYSVAEPIIKNLILLISYFRKYNIPIIFTQHGHRNISRDGGMLNRWWGDLIQYGSPEWNLIENLNINSEDIIIHKNRYNAFHNTDLDNKLKSLGSEEVIIAGVLTNCCCETTARDAFVRDYRVFFVADATAAADNDLHIASLKNLAYGFAHIVSTDDLVSFI